VITRDGVPVGRLAPERRTAAAYVAELTRNDTGRNEATSNETTPKGAES